MPATLDNLKGGYVEKKMSADRAAEQRESKKVPFFARSAEGRLVVKTNIKAGEHQHKEADIKNP